MTKKFLYLKEAQKLAEYDNHSKIVLAIVGIVVVFAIIVLALNLQRPQETRVGQPFKKAEDGVAVNYYESGSKCVPETCYWKKNYAIKFEWPRCNIPFPIIGKSNIGSQLTNEKCMSDGARIEDCNNQCNRESQSWVCNDLYDKLVDTCIKICADELVADPPYGIKYDFPTDGCPKAWVKDLPGITCNAACRSGNVYAKEDIACLCTGLDVTSVPEFEQARTLVASSTTQVGSTFESGTTAYSVG